VLPFREGMIMRCVASGVALLAVCFPVFCLPGVASADSDLAHTYQTDVSGCEGPGANAWFVINDVKDSSVNATVRVDWEQGIDKGYTESVVALGPGQSQFVVCNLSWPTGESPIHRRASVVGAEQS
jgi:hypothetical protein